MAEIGLDELARIIGDLKEAPSLAEIMDLFSKLALRQRDYLPYRFFAEHGYARNLIVRGEFAELLLLCWRPGQRTPIHDHGGSVGAVLVCEGTLTETIYERAPKGQVRPQITYRREPGTITGADVPDIHQLLNLQPVDLVTLHCYAPPLSVLNTYSMRSPRVKKWREVYFYGGAGI
jgi:cysteine dioxygenase